jgi:hypothetical protein
MLDWDEVFEELRELIEDRRRAKRNAVLKMKGSSPHS